jgi:deoxyribodipyrimidine photo-lyase
MTDLAPDDFPPTREAALARLAAVDPAGYVRRRNYLDGPVTRLSPYLSHGILELPEALQRLRTRSPLPLQHKLVFEFAWREYFQHVWRHLGEGILENVRPAVTAAPYGQSLPADIVAARTGVPVIDASVRELYATGYLHNHARMWLASYVVHVRKVHWRAGADWMYGHLLDGDLASNHLSWQWVAGSFSAKPYLFNAANVAEYAPALASPGTAIDCGYEQLEAMARGSRLAGPEPSAPKKGVTMPKLLALPPAKLKAKLLANLDSIEGFRSQRVALVHPWALLARPDSSLVIGVLHAPFHSRFPWSAERWAFVIKRMRAVTDVLWCGDLSSLPNELMDGGAISIAARRTLNPGYAEALDHPEVDLAEVPRFLPDPDTLCGSFTRFWNEVVPAPVESPRDRERILARKLRT